MSLFIKKNLQLKFEKFFSNYSRIFNIDEIANSKRLQVVFWMVLAIATFDINLQSFTPNRMGKIPACWEHFLGCEQFFLLGSLPDSFQYTKMTAVILAMIFFSTLLAVKKRWALAHFLLSLVIIWKFVWNLIIFDYATSNFEYFHLIPSLALLFTKNKLLHLRFSWVLLYFFTPFVKLDEGWILGTYFSSLKSGLPLVSDWAIPIITNTVIVFELICSVGLISKNRLLQKASLSLWTAFHLYSTILVGFYYPVRCLTFLWSIFGFMQPSEQQDNTKSKTGLAGPLLAVYIFISNLLPSWLSDSPYETFEGLNYSLHMFDANHQCLNRLSLFENEQPIHNWEFGSSSSMARCYPQRTLQHLHHVCYREQSQTEKKIRLEWSLIHSKDGEPFYETVHQLDACNTQFRPFRHNKWIKTQNTGATKIGYPEKNGIYPGWPGPIPKIFDTPQIEHSKLQIFMKDNFKYFKGVYLGAWVILLVHLFLRFLNYRYKV